MVRCKSNIYVDGSEFLLYISTEESPRRWNNIKQRLGFCRVSKNGDTEGCLRLDRLPTPTEAAMIREAIGIRRKRHLSPDAMAQAMSALGCAPGRAKSTSGAPTFAPSPSG
jgi:hypothetical protein